MTYNFDKVINRANTNCYKYDWREKIFGKEDVLPLWVADMDFAVADEIQEDIIERTNHGIFGYTFHYDELYNSLIDFMKRRHDMHIEKEWITFFHGVVPSISMAINAFTEPGDKIIVQPPVYFPFFHTIRSNNRKVVNNELKYENGRYTIDFDDLEQKIDKDTKMLLFCHPHNPVGRVWTREELSMLDEICQRHNIMVVSDEIHCDIVYPGFNHIPYMSISQHAAMNSITCFAPSKTFNIAGLAVSVMVVPNKKINARISRSVKQWQLHGINTLGLTAFESAYSKGDKWLDQLLQYLQGNLEFVEEYIENYLPHIDLIKPESTYLAWMNCERLGLDKESLNNFMIQEANVGLSDGHLFGHGGEGFQRLNFACPRSLLEKAFDQIRFAMEKLKFI